MVRTKKEMVLSPETLRSFAAVRNRVKAAVAAQPRSVSLSDALAQVRKFQKAGEAFRQQTDRVEPYE